MNNIKKARMAAGLSQKYVAASLGVAAPSVSNWESGKTSPTPENLSALADLFGVTVDYLLCRDTTDYDNLISAVQRANNSNAIRFDRIDIGDGETQAMPGNGGRVVDYGSSTIDIAAEKNKSARMKLKQKFNLLVDEMSEEQIQQLELFIKLMQPKEK